MKLFLQAILLASLSHVLMAKARSLSHENHALPVTIQNYNIQGPVKLTHGNTTLETDDYKAVQPQTYGAVVPYPDDHYSVPHNGPAYVITAYQAELRHPVPLHSSPTGTAGGRAQKPYFVPQYFGHHYQEPAYNAPVVYQQQGSKYPQRIATKPHIASTYQIPVYQSQQTPVYVQQSGHQPAALRGGQVNQAMSTADADQSPSQQVDTVNGADEKQTVADEIRNDEMMAVIFALNENRSVQREGKEKKTEQAAVEVKEQATISPLENTQPTTRAADKEQVNIDEPQQDAQQQQVEVGEKVPVVPFDETVERLSDPSASADSEIVVQIKDSLSAGAIASVAFKAEKTEQTANYAEPVPERSAIQSEHEVFSVPDEAPDVTTQGTAVELKTVEELATLQPEIEVEAVTSAAIDVTEYQTEVVNFVTEKRTIGELLAQAEPVTEQTYSATEANDGSIVYVISDQHADAIATQETSQVVPEQSTEPSKEEDGVTEQQETYDAPPVTTNATPIQEISQIVPEQSTESSKEVDGVPEQQETQNAAPVTTYAVPVQESLQIVPEQSTEPSKEDDGVIEQQETYNDALVTSTAIPAENSEKREIHQNSEKLDFPLIYPENIKENYKPPPLTIVPLIYRKAEGEQLDATKAEETYTNAEDPVAVHGTPELSYQTTEVQPMAKIEETIVYSSTAESSTTTVPGERISYETKENTAEDSETVKASTESTVYLFATERPVKEEMKIEEVVKQITVETPVELTTTRAPRPYSTTRRRQYTTTTTTTTTTTPLPPVRTKPDYHRFRKPVSLPKIFTEAPLLSSITDSASSYESLESAERINSQESVEEALPKYSANSRNRAPALREQQAFRGERPYPIVTRRPLAPSEVRETTTSRVANKNLPSTIYSLRTSRTGLQFPRRTEKLIDAQPRAPSDFTRGTQRERVADLSAEQQDDHIVAESVNKVQKVSQVMSKNTAVEAPEVEKAMGDHPLSSWTFRKIKKALEDGEEHQLPPEVVVDRENSRIILPEGFALYYLANSKVPMNGRP